MVVSVLPEQVLDGGGDAIDDPSPSHWLAEVVLLQVRQCQVEDAVMLHEESELRACCHPVIVLLVRVGDGAHRVTSWMMSTMMPMMTTSQSMASPPWGTDTGS